MQLASKISFYNNCVFNSAIVLFNVSVTCDMNWLHAVSGHIDILTTLSIPIASFQFVHPSLSTNMKLCIVFFLLKIN